MTIPILRKIQGDDDNLELITRITDAQFLIGRSYDASLKLHLEGIVSRHCTIERLDSSTWSLVSHETANTKLNDELLTCNYPRLLRCGDLLQITGELIFKFECDSCERCNPTVCHFQDVTMESNESSSHVCEEMLTTDGSTLDETSANLLYQQLVCQLTGVKDDLLKHQNGEAKLLNKIVSTQSEMIEHLQQQIDDLKTKFEIMEESRKPATRRRTNQLDEDEKKKLHSKIVLTLKKALDLSSKNSSLQTEFAELKQKRDEYSIAVEKKLNDIQTMASTMATKNVDRRSNDGVVEIKDKLTELLQSEFKCVICNEIFIECFFFQLAVVINCSHTFCQHCVTEWEYINPSCPICRTTITGKTDAPIIDSHLNNILPFTSSHVLENWLRISEERKGLNRSGLAPRKRKHPTSLSSSSSTSSLPSNAQITINFHYALQDIYERLRDIPDCDEPTASIRFIRRPSEVVDLTNDE